LISLGIEWPLACIAVDKLRNAPPGDYDLVLMDLRMPEMDGLTATKILKQEMKLSVPIIALTAETSASIRTECQEIGFDDFYSKPLKRDSLKDVCSSIQATTSFMQEVTSYIYIRSIKNICQSNP
jgi:CheY-like chemotaxis protein